MITKRISIDSENWLIKLSDRNELSFAYLVPYSESIYATNPLWHDWGWNEEAQADEFENFFNRTGTSKLNVFKIKAVLMEEIVNFIRQHKINFFYFQPNTDKKVYIYGEICEKLAEMLGSSWEVQSSFFWFYFRNTESNE